MATTTALPPSSSPPPSLPSADRRTRLLGIALLVLSTFVFGFSNVMAKFLTHSYPVGEAVLFRSLCGLLLVLPFLRVQDIAKAARTNPWLHLSRMVLTAIELNVFYWAVGRLQLADVSTFYLSTPILMTAIAATALGERVGPARWVVTLVGFLGVLIALRPSGAALSLPALAALSGSVLYAVFLIITRRLRQAPNTVLLALQLLALVIAGAVRAPFDWTPPGLGGAALLASVGVFAITGYACVNRALQLAPASVVAPFQYLSIIWSVVLGYLVFGDIPELPTILGAALIIAAGAVIIVQERKRD